MPSYQLTIITPVYNGAKYIERCLRSVLDQNCDAVEHLVVDGASNDGTQEIVKRVAGDCARIRLISEPDGGQSDAMNKGIGLAAAPVISFLNGDDTYEPGALKRVLELLPTVSEPAFLVGNCNVRDASGQITEVDRPSRLRIDDLLVGSAKMRYPINPSAYFYHRSLHDRVGPYDVGDEYAMDLEFLLRALPEANVRYVNETWGNFYMLPGAKTYEDSASGMGPRRAEIVYRRAVAKLPQPRRLIVQLRRGLNKVTKVPALLVYYHRNPAMIIARLKYFFGGVAPTRRATPGENGQGGGTSAGG